MKRTDEPRQEPLLDAEGGSITRLFCDIVDHPTQEEKTKESMCESGIVGSLARKTARRGATTDERE